MNHPRHHIPGPCRATRPAPVNGPHFCTATGPHPGLRHVCDCGLGWNDDEETTTP